MSSQDTKPVVVKMLKPGKGYTQHAGAPRLVEYGEGEEPIVSFNLAVLWVASGTAKLVKATAEEAVQAKREAKTLKEDQAKQKQKVDQAKARASEKAARLKRK